MDELIEITSQHMNTIDKTFQILDLIMEHGDVRVPTISNELDIPESTVYAHLSTLEDRGLVKSLSGTYRLGLTFMHYGGHALQAEPMYRVVGGKVRSLADETGERVQFITEQNGRGIYLYVETGSHDAVRTDVHVGKIVSLHTTAAGKAILSKLPTDRVRSIVESHGIERQTEYTITDMDELLAELDEIREQQYSVNDEERLLKQRAIGVPLEAPGHSVLGSISISGPTHRMSDDRLHDKLSNTLLATADEIELNLRYDY